MGAWSSATGCTRSRSAPAARLAFVTEAPKPQSGRETPEGESRGAEVRRLPVLSEVPVARPIERVEKRPLPAQIVAAGGGFLAGLAALVLVRVVRRSAARPLRVSARKRRRGDRDADVVASRSFLVDVHLLRR